MPKQLTLLLDDGDDEVLNSSTLGEVLDDASNDLLNGVAIPPAFDESVDEETMPATITGSYRKTTMITPFRDVDITLLALSKVHGIGHRTIRALFNSFENLPDIWDVPHDDLVRVLQHVKVRDSVTIATAIHSEQEALQANAQRDLYRFHSENIRVLNRYDPEFPQRLLKQPDGPYWLFVEGDVAALQKPLIGIVGTRRPSAIGIQTTERLTAVICREGLGIVSGLAEGIDAAAHRVGLYYQAPQIAVLGTGIDIVFPSSTEGIRRRIVETGGAVISEYLPGDSYSRANFVQRNRIQAALALALTPVESQAQSGTAHTVRFTEQYQRPMFGVVRGEVAPQNEIIGVLRDKHYPVFDLDQRTEIEQLIAWLKSVISPVIWPIEKRQVDGKRFLKDLLRRVDDILADVPISSEDLVWFQDQLAERMKDPTTQLPSKKKGRS